MKKDLQSTVMKDLPEDRRAFLRKAAKAGIIAPAVATFSMSGLMARPAAAWSNVSM